MELSVLIARIASVIYISAAMGGFFSPDYYRRVSDDIYKNAALTFMMGFMAVIVGSLIVNYHNTWAGNWTVLVTILGWLALTRGVILIAFPKFQQRLSAPFLSGSGLKVFPYIALFVGLLFAYFGFVRGGV
ncbi:MAG: hypothetical protein QG578_1330 [Thermodesulfobacteriota bacterium]|nr:hypothetical protein [Thermodesulfobacteriota bacterium]